MALPKDTDISRSHDLTIDEIRSCPLFSHLSDAEAEEVIATLRTLTHIAFECVNRAKKVEKLLPDSEENSVH